MVVGVWFGRECKNTQAIKLWKAMIAHVFKYPGTYKKNVLCLFILALMNVFFSDNYWNKFIHKFISLILFVKHFNGLFYSPWFKSDFGVNFGGSFDGLNFLFLSIHVLSFFEISFGSGVMLFWDLVAVVFVFLFTWLFLSNDISTSRLFNS